jgi:hypothetical protein
MRLCAKSKGKYELGDVLATLVFLSRARNNSRVWDGSVGSRRQSQDAWQHHNYTVNDAVLHGLVQQAPPRP